MRELFPLLLNKLLLRFVPEILPVGGKVDRDAIGVVEDDDTDATADGEQEGATKKKKKAKIGAMSFGEDDE